MMRKFFFNEKGFTLIELVLVIVLLGILAVSALPNFFNISVGTARTNARDAVVSAVQAGLSVYAASQISQGNAESYPATLDSEASNQAAMRDHPLFITVVKGGVTKDWTKKSGTCYIWTGGGATDNYEYLSAAGTFMYKAGGC